jgi:cephalosporin-C deacetylase
LRNFSRLLGLLAGALLIMLCGFVTAQPSLKKDAANSSNDVEDVTTVLTAHSSDAIFRSAASYTFSVKNNLDKPESGKLTYVVTDQFNKKLLADSMQISFGALSSKDYDFTIPEAKAGFYKINFMINVTDYDDTTRRVFGIRPEEIRSAHPKPDDFDKFWDDTKKELAAIKPNYKVTERPDMEDGVRKVYVIEMQSLGNLTIRGWMTLPVDHPKNRKFPVLLMLPGYQASNKPLLGPEYETAFITLDVRGQGMNREDMQMRREDYIVSGLEDKNKYILRGIIADCLRCMDFIFSRADLNHDEIAVTGGSMGGYLSITTAALDKRVTFCAPQNPFMSDIYNMDHGAVTWPINHMKDYVNIRPGLTFEKVLDNLQYFDTKNFATSVTCPVDMGMGLLDPFVPPNNSYIVYNNFPAKKKKLFVFKNLGHEVGDSYYTYETLWIHDAFALF